jgi:GDP-fucose transporter C1
LTFKLRLLRLTNFYSNKAVLNNFGDLPLLFLFNQVFIAVILLHCAAFTTSKIEVPKLEWTTAKKLFPVVSVNIIGLVFNTLCLKGVEASFFQIARGLLLPLTIVISSFNTRSYPTYRVLIAAFVVTCGFFVGISPAGLPSASAPSFLSLVYGVLSSLFIAIHAVLIKTSLPHCENSSIQLAYWTNLGSAALLFPFLLLTGELVKFHELVRGSDITWFVWGSLVTGFFGFLLCISAVISIKVTSPITHMFSSVRATFFFICFHILTSSHRTTGRAIGAPDFAGCLALR